jgi:hypothetical protein
MARGMPNWRRNETLNEVTVMKRLFGVVTLLCLPPAGAFAQTSTQRDAEKLKGDIQSMMGHQKTAEGGYQLKATIDGKKWVAREMIPNTSHSSLIEVHGFEGKNALFFSVGNKAAVGKEISLSRTSGRAITWIPESGDDIYQAWTGKLVISKNDAQWIEGTFSGTAESRTGKKVDITDGSFRVAKSQ